MNEQELFSERMNGLLDLATDKGGILSKGEVHFYLKDVLQSEDQYEFVYQFFAEKGVRVEGWHGSVPKGSGQRTESEDNDPTSSRETGYENIEDFTGLMGTHMAGNSRDRFHENRENGGSDDSKPEMKTYTETGTLNEDAENRYDFDEPGIEDESKGEDSEGDTVRDAAEDSEEDIAEESEEDADADDLSIPAGIDESLLTEDEKRYLRYYQADLEKIEPVTETERNSLLNALAAGDPSVMNRLAEGHLYLVLEEIPAYLHAGVSVGDLIQEASIGLIEGIQSYRGMNFEAHVRYAIREALDAITEEQQASDSVARHLLDSISRADEATRKLSEDFGRAPTKEELAEYLRMDVEEVETLLKHSIDALTVSVSDEAYGKTEDAED